MTHLYDSWFHPFQFETLGQHLTTIRWLIVPLIFACNHSTKPLWINSFPPNFRKQKHVNLKLLLLSLTSKTNNKLHPSSSIFTNSRVWNYPITCNSPTIKHQRFLSEFISSEALKHHCPKHHMVLNNNNNLITFQTNEQTCNHKSNDFVYCS